MKHVLGQQDNATDLLIMEVKHGSGRYYLTCNKQTEKKQDGYSIMEWIPFQAGNFNSTIANGRKSAQRLTKLNNILENRKAELVNMWTNGQYQEIVNFILPELRSIF